MGRIRDAFNSAWPDGPASAPTEPYKPTIRAAGGVIEDELAGASAGLKRATTLAGLGSGDRVGQPGQVTAGADKGEYAWSGSAWVRTGDLIDPIALQSSIAAEVSARQALITAAGNGASIAGLVDYYQDDVPGYAEVTVDKNGKIIAGFTTSGEWVSISGDDDDDGGNVAAASGVGGVRFDLNHHLSLSQSWGGGTEGNPPVSTTSHDGSLMFVGGVRPDDDSADPAVIYASLVPAIEETNPSGVRGETPMSGFANVILDRLEAEDGIDPDDEIYQTLISVSAPGGAPIASLMKGSSAYTKLMEQITYAYQRAQALGISYGVASISFMQGKGDYDDGEVDQADYLAQVKQLKADLNSDIKAAVPGNPEVALVVYQTGSHGHNTVRRPSIDLALLQASKQDPMIVMAGPMYAYQRAAGDTVHFTATSYKQMGAVGGYTFKRRVMDGIPEPVSLDGPIEAIRQGKVVTLKFDPPTGPLVLDTTLVSDPGTTKGFQLVDSAGTSLTISSVQLVGADRVRIVAASSVPAGARVRYAWAGTYTSGQVSGPRGCLRDSQGSTIVFDPSGINKPLHNWCTLFEVDL